MEHFESFIVFILLNIALPNFDCGSLRWEMYCNRIRTRSTGRRWHVITCTIVCHWFNIMKREGWLGRKTGQHRSDPGECKILSRIGCFQRRLAVSGSPESTPGGRQSQRASRPEEVVVRSLDRWVTGSSADVGARWRRKQMGEGGAAVVPIKQGGGGQACPLAPPNISKLKVVPSVAHKPTTGPHNLDHFLRRK